MTRKHFQAVATILKNINLPIEKKRELANDFCLLFKQENTNFDKYRFLKASGLEN